MHNSCTCNGPFGDILTTAEVLTVINNTVNGKDYSNYTLNTAVQYEIEHNIAYGVNTAHLDTKGLKSILILKRRRFAKVFIIM